jgi:hypothetical protein
MIKIVLTAAVLGSVGSVAGLALAQGQQGEASGSDISAQRAHRRVMPPDPRDGCVRQLRSDAQLGYAGSGSNDSQASGAGSGGGGGHRTWRRGRSGDWTRERGRSSEGKAIAMLQPALRCS